MNTTQENTLEGYHELRSVCQKYQSTWESDTIFLTAYNLWSAFIPLIEQDRDAQMGNTKGASSEKQEARMALIAKSLFVINRLDSFAGATNNNTLLQAIKFTTTDFNQAHNAPLIGMSNVVIAQALEYVNDTAIYGVTGAVVADLQNASTAYLAVMNKPDLVKMDIKTATANMVTHFAQAEDILTTRLDLDIEVFKTTAPDFYSHYQSARATKANIQTINMLMCQINDIKGVGIKNATITVTYSDGTVVVVKKSADLGGANVQNQANGVYSVTVEKTGYVTQTVPTTLVRGERVRLTIVLVKG